jgi:signal transduction histidine kinase
MVRLHRSFDPIGLAGHAEVLHDPSARLSIDDVAGEAGAGFRPMMRDLAEGYRPNSAYWLRFTVQRSEGPDGDWWLEVAMPYLDSVELFSLRADGGYDRVLLSDQLPLAVRPLPTRNFAFALSLPDDAPRTFHLRIASVSTMVVRARIWHIHGFFVHSARNTLFLGLVHGAVLVTLLFALVQWSILREPVFGLFALFIAVVETLYVSLNGLLPFLGVPTAVADAMPGMFSGLTAATGALLFQRVLEIPARHPRLRWILPVCVAVAGIAALSVPFGGMRHGAGMLMQATILAALGFSLLVILAAVAGGDRVARYFLVAFMASLIGGNMQVLRNLGLIPDHGNLEGATQAGMSAMMVLIAAGLAQRYRDMQGTVFRMTQQREADLTERVAERTRELAEASRRAEASLDAERVARTEQRNLLSMVSHEFRTPLAVIDTAAQVLRMTAAHPEDGEEIGKILRATRRMADLMEACLNDERIESAMTTAQFGDVDVPRRVAEWIDGTRRIVGRDIVLKDDTGGTALCRADATLLNVAFSNLLDNALKYSLPATPVMVALNSTPERLSLTVHNEGAAIPDAYRDRIFDKFFRMPGTGRTPGAGLGLSLVQRIVELHDGRITVFHPPEGGVSFRLDIPRHHRCGQGHISSSSVDGPAATAVVE